jgi:flagellar protein FliS
LAVGSAAGKAIWRLGQSDKPSGQDKSIPKSATAKFVKKITDKRYYKSEENKMNAAMRNAMESYSQANVDAGVMSASPHRLITLLFDGALAAISRAKMMMQRIETSSDLERVNAIAEKGKSISQAIAIIEDGLMASLNVDVGGELAHNLYALYEYMTYRLIQSNLNNDLTELDEVALRLADIREAWEDIAPKGVSQAVRDPSRLGAGSYGTV